MPIGLDRGGLDQGKELDTKENNLCENHVFELRREILMERSCHRTVNLTRNIVKHDSFVPYDFKSFVMMLSVLWPAYIKSLNKTVLLIQCQCSVSCGQGIKKRNVTCGVADPTEKCDSRAVPISWAYCSEGICPVITLPPTTMVSRFNIIKKPF